MNQLRVQTETRRRQLESIAATLTPEQLAKFALIQETFEADTIRLLEQMRRFAEEQSPPRRQPPVSRKEFAHPIGYPPVSP